MSGTGEDLGHVVGIALDRAGLPKKLAFVEHPGGPLRFAPLWVVRDVDEDTVRLAGPRQGYHITRSGARVMRDPDDDSGL